MKKYSVLFFLTLFCAGIFIWSCKPSASAPTPVNKRLEFVKGKNLDVLKSDYRALSDDGRKELWIDKLHQIQSQPLSSQQLAIIHRMSRVFGGCRE